MQGQEVIQEGFLGAAGVLCKALAQSGSDARTFRGRILKDRPNDSKSGAVYLK